MSNKLQFETSPYLLQHKNNPVAWHPWGEEALALARRENKPILVSIGYAACHWCHVMEHESFEDADTAAIMNAHFINIKVDREERPDIDSIYMAAAQAMTGRGGWPLNVFLTPDGEPFYAGTYFPPVPRYQMPSWPQVLTSIAQSWATKQDEIVTQAGEMTAHIDQQFNLTQGTVLSPEMLDAAVTQFRTMFDSRFGGFTQQGPKFPPSMSLEFLLNYAWQTDDQEVLEMVAFTLYKMAQGGMYDQIGGGFARYSVDAIWLVPHFEKMLYDNALLARVYLHAYQFTGNPFFRQVVEETLDWVLKEMTHEDGGFYSSLDADSEGVEGKFYVWSKAELDTVLGDDSPLFCQLYGVKEAGNWEHTNILHIAADIDTLKTTYKLSEDEIGTKMAAAREKLYAIRAKRVWPGLDDKVLTAWNGLMLAAFAEAGRILKRDDYTAAAIKNAQFIRDHLRTENGRLLRTWKSGHEGKLNGYLEDYAYLADGLIALYQTTFDAEWFVWARQLADMMLTHFTDDERGGFFDTSDDHEALIFRPKTIQDNATPSPNAMAARVLTLLNLYTGDGNYADVAAKMTAALGQAMSQYPTGFAHWLGNVWLLTNYMKEVAIVGDAEAVKNMVGVTRFGYRPNVIVAAGTDARVPLLKDRPQIDGKVTAYVCENFVCQLPVVSADDLAAQLDL